MTTVADLKVDDFFSYADDKRANPPVWKVLAVKPLGKDAVRILTITSRGNKRLSDAKKSRLVVMK